MVDLEHGGKVNEFAQELSCNISEIIDLSSNLNFLSPNIDIDLNKVDVSTYPTYEKLYDEISKRYLIKNTELELFNSQSSAIFSFFSYINKKHCTIYSPAYSEYKKAANTYNYEYDLINRFTNINRAVKENSLIIFENPSTPDGTLYDIELYLKAWHKLNCVILIDETYLDFTENNSAIKYVSKYDNLYILKSITKFYSCAGLRCAVIISNTSNVKNIKLKQAKWKISNLDSEYLQAALKDKIFNKTSKVINIKNCFLLENILKKSIHIKRVYPSKANFILIELKNITAVEFQNHLKPYKILLGDCTNFDFLNNRHVRIAVKSEKTILYLEKVLNNL